MKAKTCLLFLLTSLMHVSVFSQAGVLDTTFGTLGIVITDVPGNNDVSSRIFLQDDGKIILAGRCDEGPLPDMFLARYDTLGMPDLEFGVEGLAISALPFYTIFSDVALQSDAKFLVLGNSIITPGEFDLTLMRFLNNGTVDTTFGDDGVVYLDIGDTTNLGEAVIPLPDEKIIVLGHIGGGDITAFTATRFLPNGELDTGFGIEGTVASPVDAASAIITRAQMRDDGKIFAVGYGIPDLLYSDTFIASFNADGTLNNDFGTDGIVWIDISTSSFFSFDIALQPDDKILFIGTYTDDVSGDTNMGIGRLNADGTVDETFASGGFLTIDMDGNDESGSAMHLQMDNKILIAGHTNASGHRNFVVMRLESNGDMDNLWGIDGMVTTDFAGADDKALDITLQADDKIIAAGQVNDGGLRIGMARYKNDTDIGTELQTNIFNRISLYPNPATSVLNIYLQNTEFKNAAITISNVYGQKVRVTAITSKEGHLQVYLPADMAGGLYFLMVELNGKMYNVAFEKM